MLVHKPAGGLSLKPLITAGTLTARSGTFTMWSAADPGKLKIMEIAIQRPMTPAARARSSCAGFAQPA